MNSGESSVADQGRDPAGQRGRLDQPWAGPAARSASQAARSAYCWLNSHAVWQVASHPASQAASQLSSHVVVQALWQDSYIHASWQSI